MSVPQHPEDDEQFEVYEYNGYTFFDNGDTYLASTQTVLVEQ